MGKAVLNTNQKKQKDDKSKAPFHKVKKENLKNQRPRKKSAKLADKEVRVKISTGELQQNEQLRCTQRDQRSLYIRFGQDNRPSKPDEVKKLHPDIKFVRTPRFDAEAAGSKFKGICYAFVEFGSEADCKNAKNKLATTQFQGSELFVDFVGEKSRKKKARDGKEKSEFNPSRLFISGLANGVTKTNLKEMFPKCSNTDIPVRGKKKGTAYGFVQFSSPADAKAAFDAAQDLEVAGHPITVLFAKRTAEKEEVKKKKKAEKRKIQNEKKLASKKPKVVKDNKKAEDEENKENDEDDNSEEEEDAEKEEVEEDNDENENDEEDDTDEEDADDTIKEGSDENGDAEDDHDDEDGNDDEKGSDEGDEEGDDDDDDEDDE